MIQGLRYRSTLLAKAQVRLSATSLFAILQHANDAGKQERCLAFGVWRLAFGVWRLAFGVWRLAFGVWRLAFGVWRSHVSLHAGSCSKVTINPEPHGRRLKAAPNG
jgi:hypothetical protein